MLLSGVRPVSGIGVPGPATIVGTGSHDASFLRLVTDQGGSSLDLSGSTNNTRPKYTAQPNADVRAVLQASQLNVSHRKTRRLWD